MKKAIIAICSVVSLLSIVLILFTVQGRNIRQTELDNAVTSSLEKAMAMLKEDDAYKPTTDDELVALFMQSLVVQIDSSSNLEVDILEVDVEKGLLSVEATLKYLHPIGTQGTVACQKTIILEQFDVEPEDNMVNVYFISEGTLYKSYEVPKGSVCPVPVDPSGSGSFLGWKYVGTDDSAIISDLGSLVINEDTYFEAVYSEMCTVTFMTRHGEFICEYKVEKGSACPIPADPTSSGGDFCGWLDDPWAPDCLDLSTIIIEEDTVFYALFIG